MSNSPVDISKKAAIIVKANKDIVDFLLSLNTANRTIRTGHISWLIDAVKNKQFVLTGQGVAVDINGVLVDGQHRLTAIREAGYPPVELLIVTGLSQEARIYVDQNAKRSTTDMLKIVMNKTVTTRMTAILNFHSRLYIDEEQGFAVSKRKPALEWIVDQMAEHADFLAALVDAGGIVLRAASSCAMFHYGRKYGVADALELAQEVNSGTNLAADDPAYVLREWLLRSRLKTPQLLDYRMSVSACVAHGNGRKLAVLRPSNSWDGLPERKQPRIVKAG